MQTGSLASRAVHLRPVEPKQARRERLRGRGSLSLGARFLAVTTPPVAPLHVASSHSRKLATVSHHCWHGGRLRAKPEPGAVTGAGLTQRRGREGREGAGWERGGRREGEGEEKERGNKESCRRAGTSSETAWREDNWRGGVWSGPSTSDERVPLSCVASWPGPFQCEPSVRKGASVFAVRPSGLTLSYDDSHLLPPLPSPPPCRHSRRP